MSDPKWFEKCSRVPWQPPDYVFKFVWPVLYTIYAYVCYKYWNQPILRNTLLVGLALNLAWVPIFVANTELALAVILGMIAVAIETLRLLYKDDTLKSREGLARSAVIFSPYLGWLLVALSLNAYLVWKC